MLKGKTESLSQSKTPNIIANNNYAPWHVISDKCNYWIALFESVVDKHAPMKR